MALKTRGFLYDLARNQRAEAGYLERLIDGLSEFGFNMLLINLEHRFDFPSSPGLAPPGSLSAEMARSLVRYGAERGIDVVPKVNLAGHCEGIAATELYSRLSCDPFDQSPWGGNEQLNLERSESRELAASMLKDVCDAFPGTRLHVGCDEIRRMEYLFPGDDARQKDALTRHLEFILGLARRTSRQTMIWGDMPLKHPEIICRLPKDIVICDWHYAPEGSRSTLELYKKAGFPVLACPAVTRAFAVDVAGSMENIERMVLDATDLGLEGIVLTSWEFGRGLGYDLIWPGAAFAGSLFKGERHASHDAFLSDFAESRYGVNGPDFARLCGILHNGLLEALKPLSPAPHTLRLLRDSLFRSGSVFGNVLRPPNFPANSCQQIWEPSPFLTWLLLRPMLTDALLAGLEALGSEADKLQSSLGAQAKRRKGELQTWLFSGMAPKIIADRLRILEAAQKAYHAAALAQKKDGAEFRKRLEEAASLLEGLRDGLSSLERIVANLDEAYGLDSGEIEWLRWDMKSLDAHIGKLLSLRPQGDSLLEFGEFLKRPVGISQRLFWR